MPWMPAGVDPFKIAKPESGKHYRWLRWTSAQNLSQWLLQHGDRPGYKITGRDTLKDTKKLAKELGLSESYVNDARNRIEYGDVVLAELPLAEAKRRTEELIKTQRDAAQASHEEFMGNVDASSKYIKPIHRQFGDMQERKAHAERGDKSFVSLSAGNSA